MRRFFSAMTKKAALTNKERSKRWRKRLKSDGGKLIQVRLKKEHYELLRKIMNEDFDGDVQRNEVIGYALEALKREIERSESTT
jgi:hypothetical protein